MAGDSMEIDQSTASTPAAVTGSDKLDQDKFSHSIDLVSPPARLKVVQQECFRWVIKDWTECKKLERIHSPEFKMGDTTWRLLMFPNGNRVRDTISMFLESVDSSTTKDPRWFRCVSFVIVICSLDDEKAFLSSANANHRFTPKETDWGFSQLCSHAQLRRAQPLPIVKDDSFAVIAYMKEIEDQTGVLWHNFVDWDSKLETGFVGLKNQGATCYLNSLLQSLYFTNYFRKATYEIPTDNDEPTKSVAYALQRLFYHMQFSDQAVGTNELTKSFGWDSMDAFHQHDVQELNRVLQDKLENSMKGTPAEGAIRKLFTAKMKSYIKCINVDFESSRVEDYYDIQLNVKGCKNLFESFVDYCSVETLDGENQYFAEGFGLQPAKKGVIFTSFPPVLHLQLKRFDYDMEYDRFVKINDRHEFGMELNLDQFLDEDADRSIKQHYRLQAVLVHSGDLNAGHYYAIARPERNGKWFRFDDDKVFPVSESEVLDDNFGGEIPPSFQPTPKNKIGSRYFTNAYMLVYIRECDEADILSSVTEKDIPLYLRERVKQEIEENNRKLQEMRERHLFTTVQLVVDKSLENYGGFDIGFPGRTEQLSANQELIQIQKFKKSMKLEELSAHIANELKCRPNEIRLWSVITRQNQTSRMDAPITGDSLKMTLEELQSTAYKGDTDIRLFVETKFESALSNLSPVSKKISIVLKYYDPKTVSLKFVGTVAVNFTAKISTLSPLLVKYANVPASQIILYEEIRPGFVEKLDPDLTFESGELIDGDVIAFQAELPLDAVDSMQDPTLAHVVGYYDYLANKIVVEFIPVSPLADGSGRVVLDMSKQMNYDKVVGKLGAAIGYDPNNVRLFVAPNPQAAKQPVKRSSEPTLENILEYYYNFKSNTPCTIYYELLQMSLQELESKRVIQITFLDGNVKENGPHELMVPKNSSVGDLFKALSQKLKLPIVDYRIFETLNHRKSKHFKMDDSITILNEYASLFVEAIPDEEKAVVKGASPGKVIEGFHFSRDVYRGHSIPFTFIAYENEPISATRERLAKRLAIGKKEMERIKIALVTNNYGNVKYLLDNDQDTLWSEKEFLIGLDHPDKNRVVHGGGGVKIN